MAFLSLEDDGAAAVALASNGLQIFMTVVVLIALGHARRLFLDPHGRLHRVSGAALLGWLGYGCYEAAIAITTTTTNANANTSSNADAIALKYFLYDVVLGCLGILATLSAARDFPHVHVKNEDGQSGTLERHATVTQREMIEHSFYQVLNLWQALYLHAMCVGSDADGGTHQHPSMISFASNWSRWCALACVTAPWYVRREFPVHSFSKNWKTPSKASSVGAKHQTEIIMYKIKKTQYVFYKHVILHGLNLSICLDNKASTLERLPLVHRPTWRLFWVCLNTSYVLEFFLQSLVKRGILSQSMMLTLNRLLMAVSSVAAISAVFPIVKWEICFASFVLNWTHRYHDVTNTLSIAAIGLLLQG